MVEINEHNDTEVPECNQLDGIIVYIRDNYTSRLHITLLLIYRSCAIIVLL